MNYLGEPYIITEVLIKKESVDQRERKQRDDKSRDLSNAAITEGTPATSKSWKMQEANFLLQTVEGISPVDNLTLVQ